MSGRSIPAVALAILLITSCGDGSSQGASADDGRPLVIATTSIWADVVSNVACADDVVVDVLIPAGADPHTFEPSLADRGRLESADLIVANGLGLEEGLEDMLVAVEGEGVRLVRLAPLVADGNPDPHVWFDPTLVEQTLPAIAEALVTDAGLTQAEVDQCVADYSGELAELDADVADLVASLPPDERRLVTNHDSLGYFADRYGFEVLGTVIPSPSGLAQTNPADLEALAQLIESAGVPVVFAETQHSSDDAEALAREVGDVRVVTLETGTLGPEGSPSSTYLGFLSENAETIVEALR